MGAAEALGGSREHMFGCPIRVGEDFAVPQPDHAPAVRDEPGPSIILSCLRDMVPAVEFYCEPRRTSGEINDERPHDELARPPRPIR